MQPQPRTDQQLEGCVRHNLHCPVHKFMLCSAIWKSEKEFAGLSQTDEERQCRHYMLLVQDLDGLSQCNQQGQSYKAVIRGRDNDISHPLMVLIEGWGQTFTFRGKFSNDHYKFMIKNAKIYKRGTWQNRIAKQTEQMGKFYIYFSGFQPWLNFRSNQITRVAYILIYKRDQETEQEQWEET